MNKFGSQLQTNWDWRAACNFMFGGTGSALVIAMVIFSLPNASPIGLGFVALVFVGAGLFMVWLEIGRPWRFIHVFFHPQTSWMTREALVGMALFPVALAGVLLQSLSILSLAALLGFIFLYCQGRILKAAMGVPAWREPAIVPLIMSSGFVEGAAIAIAYAYATNNQAMWMAPALVVLVGVRVWAWYAYRDALRRREAPVGTLRALAGLHREFLIVGALIPALLAVGATTGLAENINLYLASATALVAGWRLKFGLIVKASYKQGYGMGNLRKGRPRIRKPVRRAGDPVQY